MTPVKLTWNGVAPKITMLIRWHSSMGLALKYYTHLALKDKGACSEYFALLKKEVGSSHG